MSATILRVIADATWQAAILGVLVLGVQWAAGRRMPARWRFALWFLVLVRLSAVPLPESRFSVFNWMPSSVGVSHGQEGMVLAGGGEKAEARGQNSEARSKEQEEKTVIGVAAVAGEIGRPAARKSVEWPWAEILLAGYLAGVVVMAGRLAVTSWWLRGVMRRAVEVREEAVVRVMDRARRAMGVKGRVPLLVAERLSGPALVGWWRPRLVVPGRLLKECGAEELYFVFLHELAHLRRRDVVVNYWMAAAGAAHWFNPLVWVFLWRMRADRELAYDELVMERSGDAAGYGHTLLKLLDMSGAVRRAPGALGMIEGKANFKRRIRMIASFRKMPGWVVVPVIGLLMVIAGATLTTAVTKGAEAAAGKGKVEAAGTMAATQMSALSADDCLKREIEKIKLFKETIKTETDFQKDLRAEVDEVVAYLEKLEDKPFPSTLREAQPEPVKSVEFLGTLYSQWNNNRQVVDIDIAKQPLAKVVKEIQNLRYAAVDPLIWASMRARIDPRPDIVSFYEGARMDVDWKTLAMAGVRPDTLVSVKVKQDSPYNAFCRALKSLQIPNMVVDENEYPDYVQVMVVYNVRDLLAPVPSKKAGRMSEPGTPEELIKAIQTAVSPEWWNEVMHTQTTEYLVHKNKIVEFKGIITVTTTARIHGEIAAFLDKLRQADKEDEMPATATMGAH